MQDHLSPTSLLAADDCAGYRDSFTVPLGPVHVTPDEVIPAFFRSAPEWLNALMRLRDAVVGRLGLKTGANLNLVVEPPFRVGQTIGLFRLMALTPDEAVLGEDDRHLDFRTSLLLLPTARGQSLTISTVVKTHNRLGRIYFAVVKPVHRLIVPIMARRIARRLTGTDQAHATA